MKYSDSFSRREKAQEDLYIRQRERERLVKLREKLNAQKKHLDELDAHMWVVSTNTLLNYFLTRSIVRRWKRRPAVNITRIICVFTAYLDLAPLL